MPMTYSQENALVTVVLSELRAELPETFGLRAFPGDRFRIAPNFNPHTTSPHFYSDYNGGVQVVIQKLCGDAWQDFGRNTPDHVRAEVVKPRIRLCMVCDMYHAVGTPCD